MQIHDGHVGLILLEHCEPLFAVFGDSHHLDIRVRAEDGPYSLQNKRVIVNAKDSYS